MSCEKVKIVTSFNGQTGDVVFKAPETKDFYTREEVNELLNDKVDTDVFNTELSATNADVLKNKQDIQALHDITDDLEANKADKSELPDMQNYYTKAEINTQQDWNADNISRLYNTKADKEELKEYAKKSETVDKETYDKFVREQTATNVLNEGFINGLYEDKADKSELANYAKKDETVDTTTYNNFVQNQNTIDESQNNAIQGLEDNKANKEDIPDVSVFNPTDNFKTINGESIIGTGNIHIESGGGDDKMDKNHPIFTENNEIDEINPDFRLSGMLERAGYYGTESYNCVERFHTSTFMYVEWGLQSLNHYINENPGVQYAAVKGFCRADGPNYGHCQYRLALTNEDTGVTEYIDQYILDNHVYGALGESQNIISNMNGCADSRDPNDNISALISPYMNSQAAYYVRKNVVYYTPNSMYETSKAFNVLISYPYMTTLIDVKGILANYNIEDYTNLRVEMVTANTQHWHIMSTNLFFTEDSADNFIHHVEIKNEYVLIDILDEKATKTDLDKYNPTDNFKTINGESIIGTGDIEIHGGEGTQEITRLTQAEYNELEYKDPNMVYIITDAVNNYATKTDLQSYNPTDNFKTINGESIIGTGDIQVQGGEQEIVKLTQAEYNALGDDYDPNMLYVITDAENLYASKEYVDKLVTPLTPNVIKFNDLVIENGVMSNFSASNYAQFPFLVDLTNKSFEIKIKFTTGDNVISQQNILDSQDGLAFAVRDNALVLAISGNGSSWAFEATGGNIYSNYTYHIKLKWNRLIYTVELSSDDGVSYEEVIRQAYAYHPYPRTMMIGKDTTGNYYFQGTIDLNKCTLAVNNQYIWDGMADAGLLTRLETDLGNIDANGILKLKEIIEEVLREHGLI